MDQWLIRTADNWIKGPYPQKQICQMIQEGKLHLQDEVCVANGYWVFLHEREEIKNLLGVEVPRLMNQSDEEITETQTTLEEEEDPTDPDLPGAPEAIQPKPATVQKPSFSLNSNSGLSHDTHPLSKDFKQLLQQKGVVWVFVAAGGIFLIMLIRSLNLKH